MKIRVADKNIGECVITVNTNIGKSEEYAIKSLCMLQMACMNKKQDPDKFNEFIKILKDAISKAEKLYINGASENEPDAFDQF